MLKVFKKRQHLKDFYKWALKRNINNDKEQEDGRLKKDLKSSIEI